MAQPLLEASDDLGRSSRLRAPCVPLAGAFAAGILLAMLRWCPPGPALACALAGGVASAACRAAPRQAAAALLMLWIGLGALRAHQWSSERNVRLAAMLPEHPAPVRVRGVVLDDPTPLFDPEPGEARVVSCALRLQGYRTARGWRPLQGRLRVSWPASPAGSQQAAVAYGDAVVLEGLWRRAPPPGNPGPYDQRAALARQRIDGVLRVRSCAIVRRSQAAGWRARLFRMRHAWAQVIRARLSPQDAGLVASLLLGERVALEDRLREAFIATGTMHLLVVSGFNVGLLALMIEWGLRLVGLPWRLRLVLAAIGVGGYAMLTGAQPPVVRAMLMAWILLGAYAMDRVMSWINALALAALVMLWITPSQLFDPGFQLSCGAVLSLLLFTGCWQAWAEARLRWLRPAALRRLLCVSVCATLAVWVGLAPVLVWYFHVLSPVALLANLVLGPLVSVLVCLGTAWLVLAPVVGDVLAWGWALIAWLARAVVKVVMGCHALPGGSWVVGHPHPLALAGYYGLITLSLLRSRLRWSRKRLAVCWAAGCALGAWSLAAGRIASSRWLRLDVLDVGHGDAILVRTPERAAFLVDAGSSEAGRFQVVPFLRHEGLGRLDGVVLTHPDEDHIGGAVPLLQSLGARRIFTNGARGSTRAAHQVRELMARQRIPESILASGMRIEAGARVRIEVLHPPPGFVPGTAPDANDNCLVLKVTYGSAGILLTGDVEEAGLPWLLRGRAALSSTVLKVPHHGSRLGEWAQPLFDASHPTLAILSVGTRHRLPAPETLEALARAGSRVLMTRDEGMISLRTDGRRVQLKQFKRGNRWQTVDRRLR